MSLENTFSQYRRPISVKVEDESSSGEVTTIYIPKMGTNRVEVDKGKTDKQDNGEESSEEQIEESINLHSDEKIRIESDSPSSGVQGIAKENVARILTSGKGEELQAKECGFKCGNSAICRNDTTGHHYCDCSPKYRGKLCEFSVYGYIIRYIIY